MSEECYVHHLFIQHIIDRILILSSSFSQHIPIFGNHELMRFLDISSMYKYLALPIQQGHNHSKNLENEYFALTKL